MTEDEATTAVRAAGAVLAKHRVPDPRREDFSEEESSDGPAGSLLSPENPGEVVQEKKAVFGGVEIQNSIEEHPFQLILS